MKRIRLIAVAIVLAAAAFGCNAAFALTFDNVKLEGNWIGQGANKAVCVIDFGESSYAFGYQFDGTKKGFDMLQAIADNTAFDMQFTDWSWGYSIDSISYNGITHAFDINQPLSSYWWESWTSTNGSNWASSGVGVGDRNITNGSWDAWTWSPPSPPSPQPNVPTVPEPASFVALAMGLGAVLTRIKR